MVLAAVAVAATLALATAPAAARLSEQDARLYRDAFKLAEKDKWDDAKRLARQADDKLPGKVLAWLDLKRVGSGASFDTIARFIKENPDWPDLVTLRRQAETAMTDGMAADTVREWFKANPPLTTAGFFRHIDALMIADQDAKARDLIRLRWIDGSFGTVEEQDFRSRFGSLLRTEDHVARLDRLLWDGQGIAARRLFPLVGERWQALAEARMALAEDGKTAEALLARVPSDLRDDSGLLYERLRWRRRKDQDDGAIDILDKAPKDLGRPLLWWNERNILVRRAFEKGDYPLAYRLAKNHGITDGRGLAEAEFLAGWLALRFLDKPQAAVGHFERLHKGVTAPISRARGAYWSGRAAEVVGDKEAARKWFEAAAALGNTYYGQLAADRIGRPPKLPGASEPHITKEAQSAFHRRELVRVIEALAEIEGRTGERIGLFLRKLGNDADSPEEYALAARLAQEIRRPEIAVAIAKNAAQDNIILLEGYPLLDTRGVSAPEPALVHALIRQESTFNSGAVSPVGARGLMQLMPSTAQQVATKLGIKKHQPAKLTTDPDYNIRLGTTYMAELLDRFDGSYVLAIASYNAGIGRVRGWLDELGDPRSPRVDAVDWVEMIPIYETRNYVQRVMEAVMVYRARLNGGRITASLEQELRR